MFKHGLIDYFKKSFFDKYTTLKYCDYLLQIYYVRACMALYYKSVVKLMVYMRQLFVESQGRFAIVARDPVFRMKRMFSLSRMVLRFQP